MTVKIHIPSSESAGEPDPRDESRRPASRPVLVVVGLLTAAMLAASSMSIGSGESETDTVVPPPFETASAEPGEGEPVAGTAVTEAWNEQTLPREGRMIAMGMVGSTPVAVSADETGFETWRRDDGVWRLDGRSDLEVESGLVTDDRVILIGPLQGRPTVWEWIDGSSRYLFQPTTGSIAGAWSVGGRLAVSVSPTSPGIEETIRFGRDDALWIESVDGEYEELALVGIESVLAVSGDAGLITVGGRNADGRAVVGVVQNGRVVATPLPDVSNLSAVTELAGPAASPVALVSVANRRRGTHDQIWSAGQGWTIVNERADLVGVEVIDDVVVGITPDGSVIRHRLDGERLPAPPSPPWSYGFISGLAVLEDQPVAFGQSERGTPMFAGPFVGTAEVPLLEARWERYHSQAADGYELFHIGSIEFATRDAELFSRGWNGERWRPVDQAGLAFGGNPRIFELAWGFVLIPPDGTGLWMSEDGRAWGLVDGSDTLPISDVATDGEVLVGATPADTVDGRVSDVTVLGPDGELTRFSLPYQVVGLDWEDGVGFAASIVPPGGGYATSSDGLEWTAFDGPERFDWIVAFDGSLYLGSGESVVEGDPPAETPDGVGWVFSLGGTPAYQIGTGAMWIHTGDDWVEAGFGVPEGLPARPHTVVVRGSKMFAMVEADDGLAQTYVLDLD